MAPGYMMSKKLLALLALAFLAGLAGCGRKAPLDTPYQAAVEARKQASEENKPLPPEPESPEEDRPFILDPLIE